MLPSAIFAVNIESILPYAPIPIGCLVGLGVMTFLANADKLGTGENTKELLTRCLDTYAKAHGKRIDEVFDTGLSNGFTCNHDSTTMDGTTCYLQAIYLLPCSYGKQ